MITLNQKDGKRILTLEFEGSKHTLNFNKVIYVIDLLLTRKVETKNHGICVNINELGVQNSKAVQYLVGYLAKSWKHYSGNLNFPIPSTVSSKTPNEMYTDTKLMWSKSSKYGKLRWELLQHIRDELELMVAKDHLQKQFTNLLDQATSLGFTVTVEQVPNKPLMMGNTSAVVSIRRSRGKY